MTGTDGPRPLARPSTLNTASPALEQAQPAPQPLPAGNAQSIQVGSDAIGSALKAYFSDLVAEPMPDRFLELLSSLEKKQR